MAASIDEFFGGLESKMTPDKTEGMTASFQFNVDGDDSKNHFVKIVGGKGEVGAGTVDNPTIVMTATEADWLALVNGDLNGQTAFLTGKLKIQGDVTLAMKLESLFDLG